MEDPQSKQTDYLADRLDLDLLVRPLLLLPLVGLRLCTHDTTAPVTPVLLVLVQVALFDGRNNLGELVLVLAANLSDGERSGSL